MNMKKRIITVICLILCIVISNTLLSVYMVQDFKKAINELRENPFLNDISATQHFSHTHIYISVGVCERYIIEAVAQDEIVYKDTVPITIDSTLGKNIYRIKLLDVGNMASNFSNVYNSWEIYSLTDTLNWMYTYSNDHALEIYVGSNESISIETGEFSHFFYPSDTIKIKVS